MSPRRREPPPQDEHRGNSTARSRRIWSGTIQAVRLDPLQARHRGGGPGLTIFYRGQFLSRGPWEGPVPFSIHAIAISSHSPAITPLGPSQLAPTDRRSLSPFSSPISPDAITSWCNSFSVFNSAGIKPKDGTGRLKSCASPWLYAC